MFRSSLRFLIGLAFLALGGTACLPTQRNLSVFSPAEPQQVNALAADSNAFAFDLYAQLRTGDGNLFFSPYSISTALAMTSAGARGQTLDDMTRVLHFPGQAELHPAAATMTADLLRRAGKNVELTTANALWVQKDSGLRDDFLSLTRTHYRAGCQPLDFSGNSESARRTINDWTEKQTHRRIRELLAQGIIGQDTRLVLTNAIYFKAKWDKAFDKTDTRPEDFHLLGGKAIKKPLMHVTASFAYAEANDLQILEMPYAGKDFSLVILLPKKEATLAGVEANLAKNYSEGLARFAPQKVIVTVPKFEMTVDLSMKETLSRMGMGRAFSSDAEFNGIDDGRNHLCLMDAIHKAFVEISEEGTEAAAATAVTAGLAMAPVSYAPEPIQFTADRPFVFLLRDRQTGAILFLGRYLGK